VRLSQPNGVSVDKAGDLLITEIGANRVFKWSASKDIDLVAGAAEAGFSGDGGPAAKARFSAPHDVAVALDGTILIADTYNHRIRRIDPKGVINTLVGNGRGVYAGDNGPARKASLNNPQGLALDSRGNLFIADTYNHVVRRVDPAGVITTFAGSEAGLSGDGGPAAKAQLSLPCAVAAAPDGAVYICDSGNNRVRWVRPDGVIETLAGTGPGSGTAGAGYAGDGGPVEKAKLFAPMDVEVTPEGDLLISDSGNHRVRLVSQGMIRTVAGTGVPGKDREKGLALSATLNTPQKLAVGKDGTFYIADRANSVVRAVDSKGRIECLEAWGFFQNGVGL